MTFQLVWDVTTGEFPNGWAAWCVLDDVRTEAKVVSLHSGSPYLVKHHPNEQAAKVHLNALMDLVTMDRGCA